MLISVIVLIVLRLFSLLWLVQGLVESATIAISLANYPAEVDFTVKLLRFLPAVILLFFAAFSWLLGPDFARLILGKYDTEVTISGLTREDLYCVGFVFLGLYFVLLSIGNVVNWLHYYFVDIAQTSLSYTQRPSPNLYGLSHDLITLLAGSLCLIKGKKWADRLIDTDK